MAPIRLVLRIIRFVFLLVLLVSRLILTLSVWAVTRLAGCSPRNRVLLPRALLPIIILLLIRLTIRLLPAIRLVRLLVSLLLIISVLPLLILLLIRVRLPIVRRLIPLLAIRSTIWMIRRLFLGRL